MNQPLLPTQNLPKRNLAGSRKPLLRFLAGSALVLLFAGNADARPVKWEYLVLNAGIQNRQLQTLLNSNGADGWELVQISAKGVAIFKRIKTK